MSILLIVPEAADAARALSEAETLLQHLTWRDGDTAIDLLGVWHHDALDRDLPGVGDQAPVVLDHALGCGRWSLAWLSGPALEAGDIGQRRRQLIEQLIAPRGQGSSQGDPAFVPVLQPGEPGWTGIHHELARSHPGLLGQPLARADIRATRRAVSA